jgi:hypothetical protein
VLRQSLSPGDPGATIPERRKLLGQSPSGERCSGNPRATKGARAIPERRKLLRRSPSEESCSGNPRATKGAWAIPERRKRLRWIVDFSFEPNTNGGCQLLWPAKLVTNNKGTKPRMEKPMLCCHFPKFRTPLQARVAPFYKEPDLLFTFWEYPSCQKNYPRK